MTEPFPSDRQIYRALNRLPKPLGEYGTVTLAMDLAPLLSEIIREDIGKYTTVSTIKAAGVTEIGGTVYVGRVS